MFLSIAVDTAVSSGRDWKRNPRHRKSATFVRKTYSQSESTGFVFYWSGDETNWTGPLFSLRINFAYSSHRFLFSKFLESQQEKQSIGHSLRYAILLRAIVLQSISHDIGGVK